MKITKSKLKQIISEEFTKVILEKDDRCTRIAKRKYDVWPSAYASGAVVRCRKGEIWKDVKEGEEPALEPQIRKVLKDEGGAAGLDAIVKAVDADEAEVKAVLKAMVDVGLHKNGDYILDDDAEVDIEKKLNEPPMLDTMEAKKAGTESSKESSLRDWFGRKGAKGKKGGWVDCNAPDGKGGYKACGREKGEKRSKYPACRPTPGACKERGKGKSWGKKAAKQKKKNESIDLQQIVKEELQAVLYKPGLLHHVQNSIPVTENIYRPGSPCFFNVIKQARDYYRQGLYEVLNEEERDLLENSELGEWAIVEGERVPLEFPLFIDEDINEQKKKKDPPLNKPSRNTGSGKKYKVFVRDPKSGNIRKITYGDSKGGLKGGWNSPEARKSFASRHRCAEKKDKTKAGYWACRAHKDFGPGVGRFW